MSSSSTMAHSAGTVPVNNEKYVERICTHTLDAAKGMPSGHILNEACQACNVGGNSTLCEFDQGLRSEMGLRSQGESEGARERKEGGRRS